MRLGRALVRAPLTVDKGEKLLPCAVCVLVSFVCILFSSCLLHNHAT